MTHPLENPITNILANYDLVLAKRFPDTDLRTFYVQDSVYEILMRSAAVKNADVSTRYFNYATNVSAGKKIVELNDYNTRMQPLIRAIDIAESIPSVLVGRAVAIL